MNVGDVIKCGHCLEGSLFRRVETATPDQFACEESAAGWKLFSGCVDVFFGIGLIIAPLYRYLAFPQEFSPAGTLLTPLLLLVCGSLCVGFGFQKLRRRCGFIIDRAQGTVTTWKTVRLRRIQTTRKLEDFSRVYAGKTIFDHRVQVSLDGQDAPLRLMSPRIELEARALGEQIADFLRLDFIGSPTTLCELTPDGAGLATVVNTSALREAGTLQESLRNRVRRSGGIDDPEAPANTQSTLIANAGAISFRIPPVRFATGMIFDATAGFIVFGLLGGLIARAAKNHYDESVSIFWTAAPVCGLVAAFVFLWPVIVRITKRVTIAADARALRVTTDGPVRRTVCEIPIAELKELRLEHDALAAFSDHAVARFGDGLRDDEHKWMRALIIKTITE